MDLTVFRLITIKKIAQEVKPILFMVNNSAAKSVLAENKSKKRSVFFIIYMISYLILKFRNLPIKYSKSQYKEQR